MAATPWLRFGAPIVCFDVACFEKFDDEWVFQRFWRYLSSLSGPEKQSFPAGQRKAQGLLSLVRDVHRCFPVAAEDIVPQKGVLFSRNAKMSLPESHSHRGRQFGAPIQTDGGFVITGSVMCRQVPALSQTRASDFLFRPTLGRAAYWG